MRKSAFLPWLALALGAVGALIRRTELNTVFDPSSGLPKSGAGVTVALIVLTAAAIAGAVAAGVIYSKSFTAAAGYSEAFKTKSYLVFMLKALAGIAVIVTDILLSRSDTDIIGLTGMAKWIFVLLLALAGFGLSVMAYCSYTMRGSSFLQLGSVMPALLFCYWMVALYRINAGNPVLLDYAYPCLALAAGALSAYYSAGFAFGKQDLRGTLIMSLLAVYLLPIAAMNDGPAGLRAVLIIFALYIAAGTSSLMRGLTEKK